MGRGEVSKRQQLIWLGLILLTAVFLRLWQIGQLPPGLTHDEADHGITAWSIVNGERAIYFTVGYGREPLYDYATALLMTLLGSTYLAGRLTAVFFSILTLILLFLWVKRAFDTQTALITAAGFAISFWAVMSGRQALRSVTLGAFFVGGMWLYFQGITSLVRKQYPVFSNQPPQANYQLSITNYQLPIISGIFIGLAFYTYIPSRVLWFVLPSGLLYLFLTDRRLLKLIFGQTAVSLIVSLLVGAPLFSYLRANPEVEIRIQELSEPLTAVRQGNFVPLVDNILASLRLFFIEGDGAWRYNIAGKPFLPIWIAPVFLIGLGIVIWWTIRPFFHKEPGAVWRGFTAWIVISWFGLGFAPVLVTGPELATTQAIGIQPILYLFVAVGVLGIGDWGSGIGDWQSKLTAYSLQLTALTIFILLAVATFREYQHWGANPEVRVQYESTMFTAMDYVNRNLSGTAVSISTITPGQFHTPALAQMTLTAEVQPRWFNASGALVIPDAPHSTLIVPGFTSINAGLADYLETAVLKTSLSLQPDDLDRPLDIYDLNIDKLRQDWEMDFTMTDVPILLNNNLQLLGYNIQQPKITPQNQLRVATLWQILAPISGEAKLFTHLLGADGVPLVQQDRLDAPSESWQAGDYLIQIHQLDITNEMVGKRPLSVGGYICQNQCQNIQPLILFVDENQMSSFIIGEVEVLP